MKKVTFLYRDASNYKCTVEKEMTDEEVKKFPEGREDITFEEADITDDDISLIVKYGRGDDDHNLVDVLRVENI